MFLRWRLTVALTLLLVLTQAGLWIGKGGMSHVMQLRGELSEWQARIESQKRTNAQLQAEIDDLKTGLEMVEERARELGMVKPDEIFVQYAARPAGPGGVGAAGGAWGGPSSGVPGSLPGGLPPAPTTLR